MDIDKLVDEVIPPSDYKHRNGFNNIPIIEGLNESEKRLLENVLVEKLTLETDKEIDTLIVETLAYLKSAASLPILKRLLANYSDEMIKLKIATSIFEINQDSEMIDIAINCVKQLEDKTNAYYVYTLSSAFHYLIKFKNPKVNSIIEEYTNHKEYLVSYNAKQVLGGNASDLAL